MRYSNNKGDDEAMTEIKIYFYNGMSAPVQIDTKEINLTDNYKGNITDEFITAYEEMLESYSLDEMIQNQPLTEFDIYVNPTKELLQDYNKTVLLDKNQYLTEFNPVY